MDKLQWPIQNNTAHAVKRSSATRSDCVFLSHHAETQEVVDCHILTKLGPIHYHLRPFLSCVSTKHLALINCLETPCAAGQPRNSYLQAFIPGSLLLITPVNSQCGLASEAPTTKHQVWVTPW